MNIKVAAFTVSDMSINTVLFFSFLVSDQWVQLRDEASLPSRLGKLLLLGVLELVGKIHIKLDLDLIIIKGGRLIIGWPNYPFQGSAELILNGNIDSPIYDQKDIRGGVLGSKAIGINLVHIDNVI